MSAKESPEIWDLVVNSILQHPDDATKAVNAPTAAKKKNVEKEEKKGFLKKFKWWTLNFLAIIFWLYIITKLLVYDIDSRIIGYFGNEYSWIVNYKFTIFLSLFVLCGLFLWKWKTLLYIGFVVFYIPILLFALIPYFIFKRKSWTLAFIFIDSIFKFFKSFRYNLISKSLGLIVLILILFSNVKLLLYFSGSVCLILLLYSLARFAKSAVKPSWFIELQEKAFEKFIKENSEKEVEEIYSNLQGGKIKVLDKEQTTLIKNSITNSVLVNKVILIWAGRVQKYKKSNYRYLFNFASFLWVILGAVILIWLMNLAIYKLDPTQFAITGSATKLEFLLYSLSTIGLGSNAGVEAVKDLSQFMVLIAVFIGPIALLSVGLNFWLSFKESQDNQKIDEFTNKLKDKAKKQEEIFKKRNKISINEASEKIDDISKGFKSLIDLMDKFIPTDFLDKK